MATPHISAEKGDIAKIVIDADPNAIINTFKSEEFYGRFYMKPID